LTTVANLLNATTYGPVKIWSFL